MEEPQREPGQDDAAAGEEQGEDDELGPEAYELDPAPPLAPAVAQERQRHERPLEDRQVHQGEDVRVTWAVEREVRVEEQAGGEHDDEGARAGRSRPRVGDPEREGDGREEAAVAAQVGRRVEPPDQPGQLREAEGDQGEDDEEHDIAPRCGRLGG